jgi:hypothetical protein
MRGRSSKIERKESSQTPAISARKRLADELILERNHGRATGANEGRVVVVGRFDVGFGVCCGRESARHDPLERY